MVRGLQSDFPKTHLGWWPAKGRTSLNRNATIMSSLCHWRHGNNSLTTTSDSKSNSQRPKLANLLPSFPFKYWEWKSGVKQTRPGALMFAVALILTLAQKNITRHVRWKRYVNSYYNSIQEFVFGLKGFQEFGFVYGCCIPQCQRWKAKPGTKSSVAVHHLPQLGVTVHKIKLSVPVSVCSIKMSLSIKL